MDLPGMNLLRRHPVHDVDSAIRRAIRDGPLGYSSAHVEEHDPNDALTAGFHTDPASLLPFEVMSAIFMHVYDAAPLSRRSDQIAHSIACVNRQWRSIALDSPAFGGLFPSAIGRGAQAAIPAWLWRAARRCQSPSPAS
ncbi:hypothetical protein EV714DRAFT_275531 [Schizophyllum commune]